MTGRTDEAESQRIVCEVCLMKRPLLSVAKVTKAGNQLYLGEDKAFVKNDKTMRGRLLTQWMCREFRGWAAEDSLQHQCCHPEKEAGQRRMARGGKTNPCEHLTKKPRKGGGPSSGRRSAGAHEDSHPIRLMVRSRHQREEVERNPQITQIRWQRRTRRAAQSQICGQRVTH